MSARTRSATAAKPEKDGLKVEHVHPSELLPHPTNAKLHPPEQVAQIAASIREFGMNDPVAIDEKNNIIEGHGRWQAVLTHLAEDFPTIPAIRLSHLSDAEQSAYRLAHNKLTLNSGFDEGMLAAELTRLREEEFDLLLTGFDDDELLVLLSDKNFQPDDSEQSRLDEINPRMVSCPKCGEEFDANKHSADQN